MLFCKCSVANAPQVPTTGWAWVHERGRTLRNERDISGLSSCGVMPGTSPIAGSKLARVHTVSNALLWAGSCTTNNHSKHTIIFRGHIEKTREFQWLRP
jgi:hypothetical protein